MGLSGGQKTSLTTLMNDVATLRGQLSPVDANQLAVYKFLRHIEKTALRIESDKNK